MTHYDTLGVAKDADKSELKKALRKLAMKYHPDNLVTGDDGKMIEINAAYEILSDPHERAAYDAGLVSETSEDKPQFKPQESSDIFSNIFKNRPDKKSPVRGKDRKANMTISLEEAVTGVHRELAIRVSEPCNVCKGTGKKESEVEPCITCKGSRKIVTQTVNPFGHTANTTRVCPDCKDHNQEEEDCENCNGLKNKRVPLVVPVNVPAGVENNAKLLIKGCGERGTYGGEAGDLIVTITIENNTEFVRVGNDLHVNQKVSYRQLVLGDELEIDTLEGPVTIKIPRASLPGSEFRLKGQGITRLENTKKGDLVIVLELVIPTNLTEEQEKLLVALDI